MPMWSLSGYDTFAGEAYPLPGRFLSQRGAERAAKWRLSVLELTQPSDTSGGQAGIQDKVYVHCPDGTSYLFEPGEPIRPGLLVRTLWRLGALNG